MSKSCACLLCLCFGQEAVKAFPGALGRGCQCSWGSRGPVHRPLLPRSVRLALLLFRSVQPFTVYKACSPLTPSGDLETPKVGGAGGCLTAQERPGLSPVPGRWRQGGDLNLGLRAPRLLPAPPLSCPCPPPAPLLSSLPSPMLLPCLQSMWGFSKALMIENKIGIGEESSPGILGGPPLPSCLSAILKPAARPEYE